MVEIEVYERENRARTSKVAAGEDYAMLGKRQIGGFLPDEMEQK